MSKRKPTLEDAIRTMRCKVEVDEQCIILDKREPLKGVSATSVGSYALNQMHTADFNLNYQAKFWKGKCEVQAEERVLLERQLVDKMSAIVDKYEELRRYTQLLEQKCHTAPSTDNADRTAAALDTALEKITVYEMMTSMTVDINDDHDYTCTMKNPVARKATRFKIHMVKTVEGDMAVEPRANIKYLPEYLQQGEIICESSNAPVLMCDVISTLFGTGSSNKAAESP